MTTEFQRIAELQTTRASIRVVESLIALDRFVDNPVKLLVLAGTAFAAAAKPDFAKCGYVRRVDYTRRFEFVLDAVGRVEIDPDGKITVFAASGSSDEQGNGFDKWMAKRARSS